MSITIGITNDTDLSIVDEYKCWCGTDEQPGHPDCPECKGTGKLVFKRSKYERNLANANFSTLWNALGLEFDCRSMPARDLLLAVNSMNPDHATRAERRDGNSISCGLTREHIESYIDSLRVICLQAIKMGEDICWG
jgi:hypothetical protein